MSVPVFQDISARLLNWQSDVILDVGANIGQSSLAYVRDYPDASIHAVEPVPTSFAQLVEKVGPHPNVTPHNLALGVKAGVAQMVANSISTNKRNAAEGGTVEVKIGNGAAFSKNLESDGFFLKIDTEWHDTKYFGFRLVSRADRFYTDRGVDEPL